MSPRRGLGWVSSRLAIAGLALVLTLLAGTSLWTAVRVAGAARLLLSDSAHQHAWEKARFQLFLTDTLQYQALYSPRLDTRVRLDQARGELDRTVAAASATAAQDDDREQVGKARMAAVSYRRALDRQLAALDARQRDRATDLNRWEVAPALEQLTAALNEGATDEQEQIAASGAVLGRLGDTVTVAVPVVSTVGLGLLVTFALVLLRYQRRIESHAVEREHDALHDALSGLPNRVLFRDRLQQALRVANRTSGSGAVLLLDLDRFKEVNDTLGHHHGDVLLQQVAGRLAASLRVSDTVARLGGDEFAVLLTPVEGIDGSRVVANKLLDALAEPVIIEGLEVEARASIGVAVWPDHGLDPDDLLRRADVAMYAAKHSHTGYGVYDPDHDQHTPKRLNLLAQLRRAIENDELVLHYQPQADLRTGRIIGVEALVRWQHPTQSLLPPGEFVPLAERTGLIEPLSTWVLRAALDQCRGWREGGDELRVAVNLSAASLLNRALPADIEELLADVGLPAEALVLEITESTIMTDPSRALAVLTQLHQQGVGLAIDDFGTGYSSMAYLSNMPVNELKIDRSFVSRMRTSRGDQAIVSSTIELGHSLDLRVVAEGVEDDETWDELAALGCDALQGYRLARPMPAADLEPWLRQPRRQPAVSPQAILGTS